MPHHWYLEYARINSVNIERSNVWQSVTTAIIKLGIWKSKKCDHFESFNDELSYIIAFHLDSKLINN